MFVLSFIFVELYILTYIDKTFYGKSLESATITLSRRQAFLLHRVSFTASTLISYKLLFLLLPLFILLSSHVLRLLDVSMTDKVKHFSQLHI